MQACDRILVLARGECTGEFVDFDAQRILACAMGRRADEEASA